MRLSVPSLALLLAACATPAPTPTLTTCAALSESRAGQVAWNPHPTVAGVRVQHLVGHPREPGYFNYRLFFPAGFRIAPHTHGAALHNTVLCGGLIVGRGRVEDAAAETRYGPFALNAFPAGEPHWERVETDTVLQISGIGPVTTEMLARVP